MEPAELFVGIDDRASNAMALKLCDAVLALRFFFFFLCFNYCKKKNYIYIYIYCDMIFCRYVAPEAIRRAPFDRPMDMWSCGVILFILLAGIFPFEGNGQVRCF
jgi:serine/threonine protein kinase